MYQYPNEQSIFDAVWKHMEGQQWVRAFISPWGCMYRSPEGLKCAVGALIPDELYHSTMEKDALTPKSGGPSIVSKELHKNKIVHKDLHPFLQRLQTAHDDSEHGHEMRQAFRNIARENKLTVPDGLSLYYRED